MMEKEEGNALFKKREFAAAVEAYQRGIEKIGEDDKELAAVLHGNKAACYFQMKNWKACEDSARQSLLFNPQFIKGAYRLSQSLYQQYHQAPAHLHLLKEAKLTLLDTLLHEKQSDPSPTIISCVNLYRQLESDHVDRFYKKILASTPITIQSNADSLTDKQWFRCLQGDTRTEQPNVCFCPIGTKGKGVFAKKDFMAGEPVVLETPICQHIKVSCLGDNSVNACNHCLYRKLKIEEFSKCQPQEIFQSIHRNLYENSEASVVSCEACGVPFCSENCKKMAWESYHRFLCCKGSNGSMRAKFYQRAIELKKTNPLLIARMFAIVVSNWLSQCANATGEVKERFVDFGPFEFFECDGIESLEEEEMMNMIRELIISNATAENVDENYLRALLTLTNYRKFHAMIQRNAQELHPVTDFHSFLVSCNPQNRNVICKLLQNDFDGEVNDFNVFLQENAFLTGLSVVTATSMLQIGNCMNHSCVPNVVAACGHADNKIQFIACRNIKKGQEITRSYINEDLPFRKRQLQLQAGYGFTCSCASCIKQV